MVIKSVNTATARLGQYFPLFDKAQKDRNLIFLLLSKLSQSLKNRQCCHLKKNQNFKKDKVIPRRTSGLLFTHYPDGSASLGYEDYGVEIFGGADYEVPYLLDKANFNKLLN